MKQTAVEKAIEKIDVVLLGITSSSQKVAYSVAKDILESCKELEKQQMKAIWSASYENMRKTFGASNYTPIDFEEYYNENYN